jgi:cytochrome oxidase Cu insertion factor (SCO1/SenC/PrrC family)
MTGTTPVGPPSPADHRPIDRTSALSAGPPKMSRKLIYGAIAALLVLGLGGVLLDRFFGPTGSPSPVTLTTTPAPVSTTPTTTAGGTSPPISTGARPVETPLAAFMGLEALVSRPAPGLSLTDAVSGSTVSLSGLRGHVVILTFADAACDDICPVLARELARAATSIGRPSDPVTFITVNTDPFDLSPVGGTGIFAQQALASLPDWQFLTGPLNRLDAVWKAYGVSVDAQRASKKVSHNDVLYFIRPDGVLAWSATPYANENEEAEYSLPAAQIRRFAQGVATYADRLAKTP